MIGRIALLCALLAGSLGSLVGTAVAQQPEAKGDAETKAEAQKLVIRATKLYDQGKYGEALAVYSEAYAIFPSPKIIMNVGSTLLKLGRDADAANAYERFLRQQDRDVDQDPVIRGLLDTQLGPDLGRLELVLSGIDPRTARVLVDGRPFDGPAGAQIWVTPGKHWVRVETARFATEPVQVLAEVKKVVQVRLQAPQRSGEPAPPKPEPDDPSDTTVSLPPEPPPESPETPGGGYRIAGWSSAIFAVSNLTLGILKHSSIGDREDEKSAAIVAYQNTYGTQLTTDDACADAEQRVTMVPGDEAAMLQPIIDACDAGRDAALQANIFYGTALALAVASGFFLYLGYTAATPDESRQRHVHFTPRLGRRVVGAELTWRF